MGSSHALPDKSSSATTPSREGWDAFSDPRIARRGWDAAITGEERNPPLAYDTLDAMAWLKGYDDALAEREKDCP